MNRFLVILITILTGTVLVAQSLGRTPSNFGIQGSILAIDGEVEHLRGERHFSAFPGAKLRRGEVVKTGNGWAVVEYGDARIALAHNTELQLTTSRIIKLIGGRVLASGLVTVTTPWIDVRSGDMVSVVNYAWKGEVDVIPFESATTVVDNETLGTVPVSFPSIWIESERDLITSLEPFNARISSEAGFYAWAQPLVSRYLK